MPRSPSPRAILIAGSLVLCLSLGLRHAFGLFLQPVTDSTGWSRGTFGLAIATQNLLWGVAQPFAGALADRIGSAKVIIAGACLYVLGLLGMAWSPNAAVFTVSAGVLIGVGLAGVTMPIVFGAISRVMPPEKRSMAFGVAMAIGSLGQVSMMPAVLGSIGAAGWSTTLVIMSGVAALMLPLAFVVGGVRPRPHDASATTGALEGPRPEPPSAARSPPRASCCSRSASSSAGSTWSSSPPICRHTWPIMAWMLRWAPRPWH